MTSAKKEKKIHLFSKIWARLTGTSHLPARGQHCDRCDGVDHEVCWETSGSDSEHIAVELHNIERRAA